MESLIPTNFVSRPMPLYNIIRTFEDVDTKQQNFCTWLTRLIHAFVRLHKNGQSFSRDEDLSRFIETISTSSLYRNSVL